ncbi:Mediator of DNA damage checkpoint protein 1 [Balamuthia mandrillaris]
MADVTQVVDLGLEDEPNGAEQEEDAIQIPVAELHILHKDKPPETQPLFPGVNNIGRSQDSNQVWINETCVSKQHASLEIKNGMYFLKDLRSTNTTRLVGAECGGAGVQLEPYVQYQLSDGYHFSLGGLLCRFEAFKSTAQDAHSPFQVPQRRIKPLPDTPQLTFSPPGLALPSDGTSSPQRDRSLRKTDRESAKPKALFVEEGDEAEDSFLAPSPLNRSAIFRLESEEEEEEYCETQVYNRPTSSKQPTSDNYDVTSGLALPSNLLEADDGSEEQPTLAYDEDQATTSATKTAVEEVDLSSTLAYDDDMLQQEEEKGSAKPSRKAMSGTLCQMATEGASGVEATQMYGDEGEEPNNTLVYDKEESEEEYGATLAYGADDVVAEAAATLAYDSGSNREEAQRKELEDA